MKNKLKELYNFGFIQGYNACRKKALSAISSMENRVAWGDKFDPYIIKKEIGEIKEDKVNEGWTCVFDKLPQDNSHVLVTRFGISDCLPAFYMDGKFGYSINTYDDVIAWRPFPEAYKVNTDLEELKNE